MWNPCYIRPICLCFVQPLESRLRTGPLKLKRRGTKGGDSTKGGNSGWLVGGLGQKAASHQLRRTWHCPLPWVQTCPNSTTPWSLGLSVQYGPIQHPQVQTSSDGRVSLTVDLFNTGKYPAPSNTETLIQLRTIQCTPQCSTTLASEHLSNVREWFRKIWRSCKISN